jgi:hypothetical protein
VRYEVLEDVLVKLLKATKQHFKSSDIGFSPTDNQAILNTETAIGSRYYPLILELKVTSI